MKANKLASELLDLYSTDVTNDQAIVEFRPISGDLFKMSVIFTYQIITGLIPGEG
jgi:hypothetical protein